MTEKEKAAAGYLYSTNYDEERLKTLSGLYGDGKYIQFNTNINQGLLRIPRQSLAYTHKGLLANQYRQFILTLFFFSAV